MWVQRPPTAMYWRRGLQLLSSPRRPGPQSVAGAAPIHDRFCLQPLHLPPRPAARRRPLAHHVGLRHRPGRHHPTGVRLGRVPHRAGRPDTYRLYVFGFPQAAFPIDSVRGFVTFHILVWPSLLIVAGVFLALRRRLRDEGAAALQQFGEDFLPLVLLFAVSATGLMLTASYTWMKGYAYDFLADPARSLASFSRCYGCRSASCSTSSSGRPTWPSRSTRKRAGAASRPSAGVAARRSPRSCTCEDLITVENQLGYRYEIEAGRRGTLPVDLPARAGGRCSGWRRENCG